MSLIQVRAHGPNDNERLRSGASGADQEEVNEEGEQEEQKRSRKGAEGWRKEENSGGHPKVRKTYVACNHAAVWGPGRRRHHRPPICPHSATFDQPPVRC